MSRSDASHRLVSSRCPECGAPVDFRNVPRDQAQVKCTYCGTLINIPGRSLDRSRTATPPPNTPPIARVFVTSEPKRVRVHGGCSAISLLILGLLLLLAGLAVCFWESDECRFEVLDRATGTSRGQVREAVAGTFAGAAWAGNRGYLTIDSKLYALNLTTAAIEYIWP